MTQLSFDSRPCEHTKTPLISQLNWIAITPVPALMLTSERSFMPQIGWLHYRVRKEINEYKTRPACPISNGFCVSSWRIIGCSLFSPHAQIQCIQQMHALRCTHLQFRCFLSPGRPRMCEKRIDKGALKDFLVFAFASASALHPLIGTLLLMFFTGNK